MAAPLFLLAALLAQAPAVAAPSPPRFDPAAEQARQSAAVRSLQSGDERQAADEQAHRAAAAAKPGEAQARAQAAEQRAQTPEGRMEAEAEAQRDAAQPKVKAQAAVLDRGLAVQPDATGRDKAAHVEAVERQARGEAKRMAGEGAPPR